MKDTVNIGANTTTDKQGRIIHPAGDQVIIDPRTIRSGRAETHLFDLNITSETLTAVPGVDGVQGGIARVTCRFESLEDCIVCRMTVDSTVQILDEFKLKDASIDCTDSADLTLSKDPEMADVLPDERGRYDLTSNALALFFSSIPSRFSSSDQEVIEGDGYEIISEDEFKRRTAAGYYSDNPFSGLDGDGSEGNR